MSDPSKWPIFFFLSFFLLLFILFTWLFLYIYFISVSRHNAIVIATWKNQSVCMLALNQTFIYGRNNSFMMVSVELLLFSVELLSNYLDVPPRIYTPGTISSIFTKEDKFCCLLYIKLHLKSRLLTRGRICKSNLSPWRGDPYWRRRSKFSWRSCLTYQYSTSTLQAHYFYCLVLYWTILMERWKNKESISFDGEMQAYFLLISCFFCLESFWASVPLRLSEMCMH